MKALSDANFKQNSPGLIKPRKTQHLRDIVTIEQAKRIFAATRVVSYRVFFFTHYSLGLRLGGGLRLQVGNVDAARGRVHIRNAKGNQDRFVPLPLATHKALQRFWHVHRNPVLLFPNRHVLSNRLEQRSHRSAKTQCMPYDLLLVGVTLIDRFQVLSETGWRFC